MSCDIQQAETCLQSLDLVALFRDALGWLGPSEGRAIAIRAFNQPYRAHCIAQRGDARIWEIKLTTPTDLNIKLKARLYYSVHKKYPHPLIIFTERQRCRSLWYWQNNRDDPQSLVFIPQQPLAGWRSRLDYLANYSPASGALDLQSQPIGCIEFTEQLQQHLTQLSDGITGINNVRDRRWYAAVLLHRLIIVHLLQRRGFLDQNIWYLHNQLGRSQQQQQNIFFRQVLQPLFTQGFSLPALERPRRINWVGQVPYLGDVFYTHPLEQQYDNVDVTDSSFESILLWFESSLWQQVSDNWQTNTMSLAFEQVLIGQSQPQKNNEPVEAFGTCCDLLLNQFMLRHLDIEPGQATSDFWDILFCGHLQHLRQLVQTILPQFSILDPACGTGSLLITLQHRLVDIYSALIGQLTYYSDSQLDIWLKGLQAEHPSVLQTIYRRIFKYGLYGVDINPTVVDIARFQLLLGLVVIAQQPQDVEPLPSLDFNIVTGDTLVGFIRVDEAGFDRLRAPETLLQGNLLQPLAAQNYRDILSEKNIALEHYQSQSYVLEELSHDIPHYAQLEFFRDQINRLDARAQAKLNEQLLTEFSQNLGIQFREAQLTEAPRRRLLRIEDLTALRPFHWGYHFSHVLKQSGGFSLILSRPPQGTFRPTTQEFFQIFCDLASQKKIDIRTFKTAKRSLLNADTEIANAWLSYQSQYSLVTDYFYRSPQYDHQSPLLKGKRQRTQLRRHWLFIERCFNLLAPHGVCGLVISNDIKESPRGVALRSLLENQTDSGLMMSWPSSPSSSDQCLLWFCKT
ncbi:MAG: hypothetical protein AAGF93_01610 [Cyanobacteria bacterium P01_H01_bin.105]